jgi:hypothetical protein
MAATLVQRIREACTGLGIYSRVQAEIAREIAAVAKLTTKAQTPSALTRLPHGISAVMPPNTEEEKRRPNLAVYARPAPPRPQQIQKRVSESGGVPLHHPFLACRKRKGSATTRLPPGLA